MHRRQQNDVGEIVLLSDTEVRVFEEFFTAVGKQMPSDPSYESVAVFLEQHSEFFVRHGYAVGNAVSVLCEHIKRRFLDLQTHRKTPSGITELVNSVSSLSNSDAGFMEMTHWPSQFLQRGDHLFVVYFLSGAVPASVPTLMRAIRCFHQVLNQKKKEPES